METDATDCDGETGPSSSPYSTILHRTTGISTINNESFSTNYMYFLDILKRSDIVCVQEHWLFTFDKSKLIDCGMENGFQCYVKCCDEFELDQFRQNKELEGGCGILWKDKLDPYIEKFSGGSERICVILIHLPKKTTCIIAAYMPTTGLKPSNDLYKKYLDEIGEIVQKFNY